MQIDRVRQREKERCDELARMHDHPLAVVGVTHVRHPRRSPLVGSRGGRSGRRDIAERQARQRPNIVTTLRSAIFRYAADRDRERHIRVVAPLPLLLSEQRVNVLENQMP